jgi:hypothetical protein
MISAPSDIEHTPSAARAPTSDHRIQCRSVTADGIVPRRDFSGPYPVGGVAAAC